MKELRDTHSRCNDPLEQAVEPQAAQQSANKVENTGEKKADTADNLCQGFCERRASCQH
jgi:hypothetical protein